MTCPACGWGFHRDCAECQKRADDLAARIRDYPEKPYKTMPKTPAERQADFKQAMKDAGYVRLEAYVTREQREKFRALGGDAWLRKRIDAAKEKK